MKLFWLASGFAVITGVVAAPDEAALGKAEGYPVCDRALTNTTRCFVGAYSHADQIYTARAVTKGPRALPLKRAPAEPAIRYSHTATGGGSVDDYLARNRTTGLLVLRGDTILLERYQYDRKPEHRFASASMAKTFVAMLVGIAIAEGKIASIDDRAEKYVPELKGTTYGETSLRHLLLMSSGVRFTENYSGNDDFAAFGRLLRDEGGMAAVKAVRNRVRPAGQVWNYSSAETEVLGFVLSGATGKNLSDYLSEKIWQPMGAEADANWILDKSSHEMGFAFLNVTLRDYARFGMLLANDGMLDGKQIIPAAWVREATTPPARQFEPGQIMQAFDYGYAYQVWTLPGEGRQFVLRGLRGQSLFVDPKTKTVMVHTAVREIGPDPGLWEVKSLWLGVLASLDN